jgi:hypothetical protein
MGTPTGGEIAAYALLTVREREGAAAAHIVAGQMIAAAAAILCRDLGPARLRALLDLAEHAALEANGSSK